jgi:excisionase family DNA binding protein
MQNDLRDIDAAIQQFRNSEPFVKVAAAAAHFGTSIWSLYRLAEQGRIPSYKIGGKRRFKLEELEAVFRACA